MKVDLRSSCRISDANTRVVQGTVLSPIWHDGAESPVGGVTIRNLEAIIHQIDGCGLCWAWGDSNS